MLNILGLVFYSLVFLVLIAVTDINAISKVVLIAVTDINAISKVVLIAVTDINAISKEDENDITLIYYNNFFTNLHKI